MKIDISGKSFGGQPVLGRISLALAPGETVALTGHSGVGKSTLARIIAGLDRSFDGTLYGAGRVGMVFQEPTLLPWRTALANIRIATGCDEKSARTALEKVELGDRLDAYPGQLSLGQQRRVALARALAVSPDTLILDEAFASLDEATSERMRALTLRILKHSKFSTLLVTHNLQDAVDLADRVILLDGKPAVFRSEYKMKSQPGKRDTQAELIALRKGLLNK